MPVLFPFDPKPLGALRSGLVAMGVLACAACSSPGQDAQQRLDAERAGATAAGFAADQRIWREQRLSSMLKPDGWSSLIGLHWLDPGPHYVGSSSSNGIRLAMGPPHLGMIDVERNGRVRLVPDGSAALTFNGQPLTRSVWLQADDIEAGPSKIGFDGGKGLATVIKRGGRFALRVRHAEAPTLKQFTGLEYWPADPAWRIEGKFIAHPPGKTLPIANIIGITENLPNPGVVEFKHSGRTFRIETLDEGGEELFLVFADRTSGHGSYGAGRFLDMPKPNVQGRVVIDFNKAYNPPCAFTAYATCPLPPDANRLDLKIEAGEKNYSFAHVKP